MCAVLQVYKLLHLFSMNKLELEVSGRHMSRTEDMKSDQYPVRTVGRSIGHRMLDESVQNEQGFGENNSPILTHYYQGDCAQYNREVEYGGFNASDILVNKPGRSSELGVDYTSGYVSDYLQSKDESRFAARDNGGYIDNYAAKLSLDTASGYVGDYLAKKDDSRICSHANKDHMDTHLRPYTIGGYSKIPLDKIRVHGNGRSSIGDRLIGEDLRKTDQRMIFSDDNPGLRDTSVHLPVFYRKPNFDQNSSVENHCRSTSAMINPFQSQIINTSSATQGYESSILYPDAPGLNIRQSSVGINGSESIIGSLSPTSPQRNSLRGPPLMHPELKDNHRRNSFNGGFSNSVLYGSNRDCMPFNEARNSDHLASESALYEARNSPSLKSSPAPILSSDIGNSGRVHEPFSPLLYNHKSYLGNSDHPLTLQNYPSHEITVQKNNDTLRSDVLLANEGHCKVQYGDSLGPGYDIGCYGDSLNSNHDHSTRKSSVFSRLSFVQDVNKQENGNTSLEEYDFHTSVDEVMDMVRHSLSHEMTKRKPKSSQPIKAESLRNKTQICSQRRKIDCFENAVEHNKAESSRNKTQINSPRKKWDCSENGLERSKAERSSNKTQTHSPRNKSGCFENSLEDLNMGSTTGTGGNSNTTAEEINFVDFKRRSKVRKHSDEIERSSNNSKKSENLVLVQQKRRKLIRPNFNNSTSFDGKNIDLGASRNLQLPLPTGSCDLEDVIESCCTLVNQSSYEVKTEAVVQHIIDPTHSEGKNTSYAMGFICSEGQNANNGILPALIDGSQCVDNKNHQEVLSSASCEEESSHTKEGSCIIDNTQSAYLETESLHAICQENNHDRGGINADDKMPKDCGSFSIEAKDGSEYLGSSGNEKASIETSCHMACM